MSFCFDVKEELCKIEDKDDACKLAELYGMILFAQAVKEDHVKVSTENVLVINRLQTLSAKLLGVFFEMNEAGVTYNATMKGEALARLYHLLHIENSLEIIERMIHSNKLFAAFLRGAVLSGGYFNDPINRYHFELVTSNYSTAKSALEIFNNRKIPVKMVVRRANYVVYLKDSQQIYDLLYRLGARNAAFELMNVKIEKETNNNNNRMDNCVAYNMDKALNKAVEQVRAIEQICNTVGLSALPDDLLYVAVLRRENPTSSLNELAALCEGRLSKPSLSRKLNKIVEFAKTLEG
ncbi:MAG: DNA-binding protein WhiA [Clostridia bacterium]|nr:DNA-binding protein WhiA [Clostridia bacterium]